MQKKKEHGKIHLKTASSSHHKLLLPRFVKPVIFVVALCTTVGLFTLPIIFYFVSAYSTDSFYDGNTTSNATLFLDNKNLSTSICDSASWQVIQASVDGCQTYTGSVCLPYLMQRYQCIPSMAANNLVNEEQLLHIHIDSEKTQDELEEELLLLQNLLANYPECQTVAVPFACHYYFPLIQECSSTDDGGTIDKYSATQEDCVHMRDTVCPVPWQIAKVIGYGDMLPDCSTLPPSNVTNNESLSQQNSTEELTDSPVQSNVSCRDDFFLVNHTCFPRCDRFQELSEGSMQAVIASEIVASLIALLVSIVALLLSVIFYRDVMFKFPSIFLIFFTIDVFLFAIVVLILPLDRSGLMCSSINLIEALQHPTVYCIISGVSYQYLFINMATWWLMHLSIFFYEIVFPFHAHRTRKLGRMKYLAVILTTLGFIIPIPGVLVSLVWKENQYGITRFPPTICVGGLWFYTLLLPFDISIGLGVCILITVLWIIHKGRQYSDHTVSRQSFTTAEKKIMVVFICFVGFGVFSLIHYSIRSGNLKRTTEAITNYFLCESTGHVPGKCDRDTFEQYIHPYLDIITFIFMGIIPIAVLNFIVNWENLWQTAGKKVDKLRGSMQSEKSKHEANLIGETSLTRLTSTRLTSVDRVRIMSEGDIKTFKITEYEHYREIILETPV